MKEYQYYFFDVDGTLLDTMELIYQTFRYTCLKYGNFEIDRKDVTKHVGIPIMQQMKMYFKDFSDEKLNEILASHREYQKQIYREYLKLFPDTIEILEILKDKKKKTALVTSRSLDSLNRYLQHFKLEGVFDLVVTPESTENHKPDPEPVLFALDYFNAGREEALFIGDAEFDIKSGFSAGVDTAFASWGPNSPDELKTRPVYILNNLKELIADI